MLLLSAMPIAVLMNSFRIGVIGILVDNYGIEQAEGFLHTFEGWVIFAACIGLLFGLAWTLQRLQPNPMPLGEALDLDFSGAHEQARRFLDLTPSKGLIGATVLTAAISFGWALTPDRPASLVDREPFALFPREMDGWSGRSALLSQEVEGVLKADDYFSAAYRNPAEEQYVDFFVAYYDKQTEGAAIHSPEVCIPVGGWEMSRITPTVIDKAGVAPFEANRAIIQKGNNTQLVYYWFEQRGRRLTNDYIAKFYTVWDSMTMGRTDGALVRVITPIGRGENAEAEADRRLRDFLSRAMPELQRFVPPASAG